MRFITSTLHSKRFLATLAVAALASGAAACSHMFSPDVERPPAAEFGFGPNASAQGAFTATLQPIQPLRLRQLQTVNVRLTNADGHPIENAAITVEGGMPEHSHGLPTQPQVRRALGDGVYEIAGLRFSMGGWWQVKLVVDAPAARDTVTFNLAL